MKLSRAELDAMSPGALASALEQALDEMEPERYDPALIDYCLAKLDSQVPPPEIPAAEYARRVFQQRLEAAAAAPARQGRQRAKLLRAAVTAAALAACLFTAAFAVSEQFRVNTMNWLIETFPGHADVTFDSSGRTQAPELTFGWLPEEYLLTEHDTAFGSCHYRYQRLWAEGDNIWIFCTATSGMGMSIDTEGAEIETLDVNGRRIVSLLQPDAWNLYWTDESGSLLFNVFGEGDARGEDLIRLAENISW